jgi:hypothetical protein
MMVLRRHLEPSGRADTRRRVGCDRYTEADAGYDGDRGDPQTEIRDESRSPHAMGVEVGNPAPDGTLRSNLNSNRAGASAA